MARCASDRDAGRQRLNLEFESSEATDHMGGDPKEASIDGRRAVQGYAPRLCSGLWGSFRLSYNSM